METCTIERLKARSDNFQKIRIGKKSESSTDKFVVSLRKNKRMKAFNDKRMPWKIPHEHIENFKYANLEDPSQNILKSFPELSSFESVDKTIISMIKILRLPQLSDSIALEIIYMFYNYCVSESAISELIQNGLIEVMSKFIDSSFPDEVSAASMLCLSSIAYAPPQLYLLEMEKNEIYVKILYGIRKNSSDLTENTLWLIGNISSDSKKALKKLIDLDIFAEINKIPLENRKIKDSLAYCLQNICRNIKIIDNFIGRVIIDKLKELFLTNFEDVVDSIFYFAHGEPPKIDLLITSGLIQSTFAKVSGFLGENPEENFQTIKSHHDFFLTFTKLCGILSSDKNEDTDLILSLDLLGILNELIKSNNLELVQSSYWTLSNIAGGSYPHRVSIISHEIFPVTLKLPQSTHPIVLKDAIHYFRNFSRLASVSQKIQLIQNGIFFPLSSMMKSIQPDTSDLILEVITNLLSISKYDDFPTLLHFEESGCLLELRNLHLHKNPKISESSSKLLDDFFQSSSLELT